MVLMKARTLCTFSWVFVTAWVGGVVSGADLQFRHHFIDRALPVSDKSVGDYGLTALVDLDRDGDLDFVLGGRPSNPSQLYWFEYQAPDRWVRHLVGTNYLSDVGLAALDVSFSYGSLHALSVADFNGDGKPDIVVNEQEELLPPGRENPRWIIWENLGGNRFAEQVRLAAMITAAAEAPGRK
jgi:hypothetical protein